MPDAEPSGPEIKVGDLVRKVHERARVGLVLEIYHDNQVDEILARVNFDGKTETCLLENVEKFTPHGQDMWRDLAEGCVSGSDPFRTRLTFVRLKTPPSPIISAFGTARVRFYPFQFKPLLKFLENPAQRLLIADDVGLGKTIEAGYILREWRARQGLQNVLIVVPARLLHKWQQELEQRFEEQFLVVGSKEIKQVLSRVTKGSDLQEFNWIASYETLRSRSIIELLKEVRPSLDLLIMDEAHRVRNRRTNQFECADILKDCADAMVFLTATPLQTGMDNLYTLVGLLMPDTFETPAMFDEIVAANRPIIRACQMVSRGELATAADELQMLAQQRLTASLLDDPYFQEVLQRLRAADPRDRSAVVRLQRDVNEFSLLGHLLSRTRKIEVMENWPVRVAQNPHIELTADERAIYDSVRSIIRLLSPGNSGWGETMAAVTAYRYTASCIPAAVEYFRERLGAGELLPGSGQLYREEERDFVDILPEIGDEWGAAVDIIGEVRRAIQTILDRCPKPGTDSKYRAFAEALREIWQFDAKAKRQRRKVVVFSYFRRTLEYLRLQMKAAGIENRVIHGDVPMDERQDRIEEFLNSPDINVLLSSEVGGEGIDLQKASVVVNYDLPWNPMVVEQRIGRIDRIGQQADTMVIVNLVAEGTIEEQILLRLYLRIGLFRESIGEMDEILGPMELQKLILEALRGELSEAMLKQRIEATAMAAEAKINAAKSLSQEVDGLLAADQAFLDEINDLIRTRRVPDMADLQVLLLELLQSRFSGIRYDVGRGRRPGKLILGADAISELSNWARGYSIEAHRVSQRFQQGPVLVTFDADTAMEHPRAEFIQARHPLIQFALSVLEKNAGNQPYAFALRTEAPQLPKGVWTMGIWSLTLTASRSETRLEAVACNLTTGQVISGAAADELLVGCLSEARDLDIAVFRPDWGQIEKCIPFVKDRYSQQRAVIIKEAREIEERKLARIRTTWLQTLTIRRDAALKRLQQLQERGAKEFAIRMAQATIDKRERALEAKKQELSETSKLRWDEHEIAAIILVVQ